MNIVEKSFYLSGIFSSIKTSSWSTNEIKMVMLLMSKISDYKIYLPDFSLDGDVDINSLNQAIKKVPLEYSFDKSEFMKITGVPKNHLSREINKVVTQITSRNIITPHPLCPNDEQSSESLSWFSKSNYNNKTGQILIKVNPDAIDRLVAFVKYTKINFGVISSFKSSYSIYTYIFIRIIKDTSRINNKNIEVNLTDYKARLGLSSKYKIISSFKEYVLDVIVREINDSSDMIISYALIKEGRSYNKIKFSFDYKQKFESKQEQETVKTDNLLGFNMNMLNNSDDEFVSPFEAKLVSWGIRAKKVVQIESEYSLDAISKAIEETEKANSDCSIKSTKAAFFIGVLENKEFESQKLFEQQQKKAIEEQQKLEKKLLGKEYDTIQSFVHRNEAELSSYLSAKSMGAVFELSESIKSELDNLKNIDATKFKGFRSRLPVLFDGYFDMKKKKNILPNMHDFLKSIRK